MSTETLKAVKLCLRNIDLIQGRVLVQTLPSAAYNESQTLVHARAYIAQFAKAGISKDRYCIKIMATGPGLQVAKILSDEGVCILGTGVFSVEQAIACSQAGCFYISPYYNGNQHLSLPARPTPLTSCKITDQHAETRSHKEPSLWPNVKDPALEHPFSNRIAQMVDAFTTLYQRTGKRQPLIKNAAYVLHQRLTRAFFRGLSKWWALTIRIDIDHIEKSSPLPSWAATRQRSRQKC